MSEWDKGFLTATVWLLICDIVRAVFKARKEDRIVEKIVRRCKEEGITVVPGDKIFVVKK